MLGFKKKYQIYTFFVPNSIRNLFILFMSMLYYLHDTRYLHVFNDQRFTSDTDV